MKGLEIVPLMCNQILQKRQEDLINLYWKSLASSKKNKNNYANKTYTQ